MIGALFRAGQNGEGTFGTVLWWENIGSFLSKFPHAGTLVSLFVLSFFLRVAIPTSACASIGS